MKPYFKPVLIPVAIQLGKVFETSGDMEYEDGGNAW